MMKLSWRKGIHAIPSKQFLPSFVLSLQYFVCHIRYKNARISLYIHTLWLPLHESIGYQIEGYPLTDEQVKGYKAIVDNSKGVVTPTATGG